MGMDTAARRHLRGGFERLSRGWVRPPRGATARATCPKRWWHAGAVGCGRISSATPRPIRESRARTLHPSRRRQNRREDFIRIEFCAWRGRHAAESAKVNPSRSGWGLDHGVSVPKLSADFITLKSPALRLATNSGSRAPGTWPRPAEQSLPGKRRDRPR